MNKEELKVHFKQREEDMKTSIELVKRKRAPDSAIAQLLCAVSYDIALLAQHQLEKEDDNK